MWLSKAQLQEIDKENQQNCGGFALGVQGWYQLGDTMKWFNDLAWTCKNNTNWRNFEKKCVRKLLEDRPDLKPIDKRDVYDVNIDVEQYEIIGFRIRRSRLFADFHFIVCDKEGNWQQKHGTNRPAQPVRYECIAEAWGSYDGKEFYFTRKRS